MQWFRKGYVLGMNVTQRGAGANMSVDINIDATTSMAGALFGTSANVPYFGWMDATTNQTIATADPTNPRIDVIVAYIDLSAITSAVTNNAGALKFKDVAGTPAGSPVAPNAAAIQTAVGAGNPYVILAPAVAVAAAASSIVNANITAGNSPAALQIPYLWGGTSNTKGHLVPNVADDTVALVAAAQTLSNKTLSNSTVLGTGLITLGYAEITSAFLTASTSYTQVTGLTATVTVPAGGRRVKATCYTKNLNTSAGHVVTMSLWDGTVGSGTQIGEAILNNQSGTTQAGIPITMIGSHVPSAGSHTYNVGVKSDSGAITITVDATAGGAASLSVEAV